MGWKCAWWFIAAAITAAAARDSSCPAKGALLAQEPTRLKSVARSMECVVPVGGKWDSSEQDGVLKCILSKWYADDILHDAGVLGKEGTYGEVTQAGVLKMLQEVEDAGQALSSDDAFFDLGSGLGKLILQVHLTTDAGSAIGLELAPERHRAAVDALRKMRQAVIAQDGAPHVGFLEEDIRNSKIWSNATVIYMSSLCFGPDLLLQMVREMSQTLQPGTMLFSLKPLPGCHADAKLLGTIMVPMTWAYMSEVRVYVVPPWQRLLVPLLQLDEKKWEASVEEELEVLRRELAPDDGAVMSAPDLAERLRAQWGMEQLSAVVRALVTSKGVVTRSRCAAGNDPLQGAEADVKELKREVMHRARATETSAVKCAWLDLEASFLAGGEDLLVEWLTSQSSGESPERRAAAVADLRGDTLLHAAATAIAAKREGLVPAVVAHLAERNADLDARGFRRLTPLQVAAEEGSKEAAESLLDAGAKVDGPDDDGPPPLHGAARNGHWEIAELLLDNGAEAASGGALSVSSQRGQMEVTKVLLDHRAEANGKNTDGRAPLSLASEEGHDHIMELLIERGAFIDDLDDETGSSPLHLAAQRGHIEAAGMLLQARADTSFRDKEDQTPLHRLRRKAHRDMRSKMLPLLVKHGAEIDALDRFNSSLLMTAAVRGDDELMPLLLASRADVLQRDASGATPLNLAAARNRVGALELLLGARASIDTVDGRGNSPLGHAAAQGFTAVIEILLKAGASPDSPSVGGEPAIYSAAKWGHVPAIQALLQARASTATPSRQFSKAKGSDVPADPLLHAAIKQGREDVARLLIEQRMSPETPDHRNRFPLHRAAEHASSDLADFLLEKKAAAECRDDDGLAPIHLAAIKATSRVITSILKAKASVNLQDNRGRTPLSHAASKGHVVVVLEMLKAGATKDTTDESGWTALRYANQAGHVEVKSILSG